MKYFDAKTIAEFCNYHELVETLAFWFRQSLTVPVRQHLDLNGQGTFLLMPASDGKEYFGTKLVSVYPENTRKGMPAIQGIYCLFDYKTGAVLASFDAVELTARRTAAASALASAYLSNKDAHSLCILGTGKLCSYMIEAHAAVRPIKSIRVWGRDFDKARAVASGYAFQKDFRVQPARTIEAATRDADIISTITSASEPILHGRHLKCGVHVDLVGAHTQGMCEADPSCFAGARVFVDTTEGALQEAGDLLRAIQDGVFTAKEIICSLSSLADNPQIGRLDNTSITIFKSVGYALEDLAAATLVYSRHVRENACSDEVAR